MKYRKKRQPHSGRRHEPDGPVTASSSQSIPSPSPSTESPLQQQSLPGEIPAIFQAHNPEPLNSDCVGFEEESSAQSIAPGFESWELSGKWFPTQVGEAWMGGLGVFQGQDFQHGLALPRPRPPLLQGVPGVSDPAVGFAEVMGWWGNARQEVEQEEMMDEGWLNSDEIVGSQIGGRLVGADFVSICKLECYGKVT